MSLTEFEKNQIFQKGYRLYKRGAYEKALEEFKRLVDQDGTIDITEANPLYLSFYSISLARYKKDYETAQKLSRASLKHGDNHPDIYINYGQILELAGKKKLAIENYRNGFRKHPNNIDLLSALQRLNPRGSVFFPFLDRRHFINRLAGIFIRRNLPSLLNKKKTIK